MGSLTVYNRCIDKGFKRKVEHFAIKAAIAVLGEDSGAMGAGEHDLRVTYANEILAGTANIEKYSIAVGTNPTVFAALNGRTDPSDGDIEFTVNSMFSNMAGYDG